MPYEIAAVTSELLWLNVSGRLTKKDYDAACQVLLETMSRQERPPRLLVSLDDFLGWEGSQEWNDMTFLSEHGDRIAKVAVVGDRRWEDQVLMFSGAPLRKTPVRFFDAADLEKALGKARAWLAQ
jgi:stage II sporulation SpoAA-like protein